MERFYKSALMILALVVFALTAFFFLLGGDNAQKEAKRDITVGLVLPGAKETDGWSRLHYDGAQKAAQAFGVKLIMHDKVDEKSGAVSAAIESLAKDGAQLIFLASYNYPFSVQDSVIRNKHIDFYTTNPAAVKNNLYYYFARLSEARYISGALAAKESQSGKLGYVAAESNSEVNIGLNAFALGARAVKPNAKIFVQFTGSWNNPAKERAAVRKLKQLGCDIVTNHQNDSSVDAEASARGMKSIAFSDAPQDKSNVLMTVVLCWEGVYREAIKSHLLGRLAPKNKHVFAGLASGAVAFSDISPSLTAEDKALLGEYSASFIAGRRIYIGEIKDNTGKIRIKKGAYPNEMDTLKNMDWFVEGIEVVQ